MNFKLKTSKETMKIFIDLGNSLHLQPYILSKISIALSLKCNEILGEKDFLTDNEGIELNRQTITGEYDELFKALIISNNNEKLDDDQYFPKYIKAHLDRGAKILYSQYRYNPSNFYKNVINIDSTI
jgi:hypothetical protein